MTATEVTTVDPADLVPLEEGCEWKGGAEPGRISGSPFGDDYLFELTETHLAELDAALSEAEARVEDVLDITAEDFPLPTLGPALRTITDDLINGRGVVLIRGVDVERYGKERATTLYWGVGAHLGAPWPQNAKGHLLGDVTDQGKTGDDPTSRGYELGGVGLPFHSDGSDLVGLFCLDPGLSGGESIVANAVTCHNELVRDEPDLAAALYGPFPYDLRGEHRPGSRQWYTMPIFTRGDDRLFVRYIRPYINSSRRHADAPRVSEVGLEAMNRLDSMCNDPTYHVSMLMQPGDMQFVNNHHVLHARRPYEDDRSRGVVRHLKRLWLETDLIEHDHKPERFRLTRGGTTSYWASKGRTKSEITS